MQRPRPMTHIGHTGSGEVLAEPQSEVVVGPNVRTFTCGECQIIDERGYSDISLDDEPPPPRPRLARDAVDMLRDTVDLLMANRTWAQMSQCTLALLLVTGCAAAAVWAVSVMGL